MKLGERIKSLRESKGLSLTALAQKVGVSRQAVSDWENRGGVPRPDKTEKLARVLGVSPAALQVFSGSISSVQGTDEGRQIPVLEWSDLRLLKGRKVPVSALSKLKYFAVDPDLPEESFAVTLADDSMEPDFFAGEKVVIAPDASPRDGDYVLAHDAQTGGYLFRKFVSRRGGAFDLVAEHPNYPTTSSSATGSVEIVGVMEEHRRRRRG